MHALHDSRRSSHLVPMVKNDCSFMLWVEAKICSRPIHYTWDQVRPGAKGYCFKQIDFFIGSGAINATLNFLIFGLVGHSKFSIDRRW